ncbi:protein of unknown function [Maridesulfovibrio hydrothermalis AM13 = DSM 14728]|uniref:Uncharacterized protein n=1 Tax=Maridesulfovibrio hydrothermalis AM13 = DSM 14728 TaxID=1121451 RepID=L0R707_9BACT|nr:protein of unknown function [Maridesulfovibrio hydrothermalis AM13 = DSM 14728]
MDTSFEVKQIKQVVEAAVSKPIPIWIPLLRFIFILYLVRGSVKTHTDMDTSFEAMDFIYLISNYLQSCFQLCPKK